MTTYYESMFLLDPADAAHNWDGLKQHVSDLVTRCGGEILYTEKWPDRKLAYEIKGRRKGTYFLMYFQAEGDAVAPLRRESKLSERVLRLLIIKNDRALEDIERRKETQKKAPPSDTTGAEPAGAPVGDEAEEEFGADEAMIGADADETGEADTPTAEPAEFEVGETETPDEEAPFDEDEEPVAAPFDEEDEEPVEAPDDEVEEPEEKVD